MTYLYIHRKINRNTTIFLFSHDSMLFISHISYIIKNRLKRKKDAKFFFYYVDYMMPFLPSWKNDLPIENKIVYYNMLSKSSSVVSDLQRSLSAQISTKCK